MDVQSELFRLEKSVKRLELCDKQNDDNQFISIITSFVTQFLYTLPDQKASDIENGAASQILDPENRITETGRDLKSILQLFDNAVLAPGLRPASAKHFTNIPSGGIPASAFADLISGITNKYVAVRSSSPGGTNIENLVLEWAANLFGFNMETYGGNLTSGTSIGILISIGSARQKFHLKGKDYEKAVIYSSELTHFCLEKAFRYCGMEECVQRKIPLDEVQHMDTTLLQKQLDQDIKNGLNPFMIVGTAGYTLTGSVDDLVKLSDLATKFDTWFHVDAAYGGFFCLVEDLRKKFEGIEFADSLVVDAHKSLFLPFCSGIVLIRNKEYLLRLSCFSSTAFFIPPSNGAGLDPAECSPELTKPFRGLRLWLPLMYHGVGVFRDALREKRLLALYAYDELKKMDFVVVSAEPDLSVFLFRYIRKHEADVGALNDLNSEIIEKIEREGDIMLRSAIIDGLKWIRVAILCFRSHIKDVDKMLAVIRDKYDQHEGLEN